MDHQADPDEKLADNPKRIWLAPRCMIEDRTWCEDDIGPCDECGEETVEYVRRDLVSEAERNQLRDFARWVETWVSQPVGAFSVDALDGLFGMARDRLAKLEK